MRSIFAKGAAAAAAVTLILAAVPADARSWRHHGGGHHYRYHGGHHYDRHYGGWGAGLAGFAAGALIGGALASQPRYYYAPGPGYYGSSAVAYCERRFRSYDPASGTYLGYDGYRHPCP